ncbi:hypothetical protein EV182_002070 [Spiromyces aspiralis]|uniref:Uncharacterized protein n=1 Tax=Spiromyces aspiralis TaxID=68401 RepID=A0ACC1HEN1_9FUNG|nr:hypothetical protein EV182_002070 [Spiromyces aspiralis]
MPPETGIFTYDSELNRRKRHEESMKRMAELRLKQQVQTLEDNLRKLRLSLQQGDRASLLARQSVQLWIPDTTVWMNYLSTLKKWVKSGGVVLVLTQSVIDGLDQFKKEATDNGLNAREATRFIESVLQHQWSGPRGHPGRISIIVQRPEHSLGSWAKDAPRYIAGGYLINHTPILSRQRSSTQASSFTSSAPQESQPSEQSLQKNVEPNFVTNLHSPIDDPPSLFAINGEGVPPSNPNFRSSVIIASRLKHPEFASSIGTDNSNGVEGLSEKSIGKMMSINENPTSSASASTSCAGSLSPPAPEMAAADNVPLRYRRFLSCAIYYAHVRSPNMSVEQLVTGAPVHTIATHSRDGSGGGGDDNVGNSNNNSNNDRGTVISSVLIISDDEQLQIFAGWFGVECISFMASQARLLEGGNGQQHQQGAPGTTDNNQTDNALSPLILPSNAADVGATNTVPE